MPALSTVINQAGQREFTRLELAQAIVGAFNATDRVFDRIQQVMLDLLTPMPDMDKKSIINDPALNQIFVCETSGPVRAKLIEWMAEYTPIKCKFERTDDGRKTGKITGLTIPKKNAKEWNLAGAKANPFMEFSASSVKALSDPRVDRGIDALVREIARTVDIDETYTLAEAQAYLQEHLMAKLAEKVLAARESEKHEKWVARFQLERDEAKRV